MEYIEVDIKVNSDFAEILLAELAETGYESFMETDGGLLAYILKDQFNESLLEKLMTRYQAKTSLSYTVNAIEKQNWNKEWETHFSPIDVDGKVYIRATFHEPAPTGYQHEIIIVPKMSFGTGHHETTSQMISLQLDIDHQNKSVLDVGTGTGILAVMAHLLGASRIHSFDIDEWSVENGLENYELNRTENITIEQGTIHDIQPEMFDIVLANINRNVLLDEIPVYAGFSKDYLLVSGFYIQDIPDIEAVAVKSGFKKVTWTSKNNWAAIVFRK